VHSLHAHQHLIWVFDVCFHKGGEAGDCGAVEYSVVCGDTETNAFLRVERVAVLVVIRDCVWFADCDDCCLRPQNCGHEVASPNIANRWNTECRICKVTSHQLSILWPLNQRLQIVINLHNRFLLNSLDVRHRKSIRAVNSHREIMIFLNNVALNQAILIDLIIHLRVHQRELHHR